MTVRQLLCSLDSRELAEWRQFFIVEREHQEERQSNQQVESQLKHIFSAANE